MFAAFARLQPVTFLLDGEVVVFDRGRFHILSFGSGARESPFDDEGQEWPARNRVRQRGGTDGAPNVSAGTR